MPPVSPDRPRSAAAAPSPATAAAMTGAVDLAAVKARSEAAARAASAPPPAGGQYVVAVDQANFQAEVLDRSFQVPVLLDLAGARSEASQQLSPLLDKLANEARGRFVVARIDVDGNPQMAQMLQVQAIPTVFAVISGQLVPGFQGSLPEPQLREFIVALLDAAAQAGLSGSVAAADGDQFEPGGPGPADQPSSPAGATDAAGPAQPPEDPRFSAAEQALDDGDFDLAAERYNAILAAEPANSEAQLALRQVGMLKRLSQLAPDVLARADAAPDDAALQLSAADAELANNQIEAAFARLIGLIRRLRGDERSPIRERLVEYFELLGPDDPRVAPARRELANALF
ncbi:tetratricopeptide repeat protein [Jatrophihabitans telluris]|uniref:Tetratricopeptide repeat protein n=1 Tax=Jatrophihabitans telluris TaxID=2038343 RepID=A0ABY4R498_9ACTN|nr:tetratricopeptide repeat protein [Jatrophihabitans telluris]UQX89896.1 tetratricopeptide repeat protein [Jatrophihabitans telluris]